MDVAAEELARKYVWWQPPEQTLAHVERLLVQLMQLGTDADVRTARRLFGDDAFRAALAAAPPGVLDASSWNFWHLVLFHRPPPPLPARPLPR
jgi:hypothetical protein